MRSRLMGRVAALLFAAAAGVSIRAVPAQAEILARDDRGFVVREVVEVGAPAPEVWRTLVKPAAWWSSEHTFSGEAANLTLDPVPGGCFCEKLPPAKQGGAAAVSGGVQHMRVVYVEPGRALRLTGALGPLQSEALLGAMTITLKTNERGTRILIEYVVGGYMRYRVEQIAPAVDRMLGQQIARLADKLGGALPAEGTGVPGAGEGGATAAPTGPDDGDSVKPAPALRNAPQGPSLAPDGAPITGRPMGTLRGLPAMPRARTAPPVVADDDGLDVSNNTTPPAAPVARPAAPKSAVKPATGKPAPNKREPAKPAVKPAPPKPAPGKAKPLPPAPGDEATAQKDAQAAFDAALGQDSHP
ncbi:hypothetical protein GCM10019060_21520 [Novosphingobium pokkalii]|nr:hypothetical protein GCM10019060_21520 [Novosphingobium pokkalii]